MIVYTAQVHCDVMVNSNALRTKPRTLRQFTGWLLIFVVFLTLEVVVYWKLSTRELPHLSKCSEALPILQSQIIPIPEGQHLLSTTEIFRRFILQPPAPDKVPYRLQNGKATHYAHNEQDRKIDAMLKKREKGFFVEVFCY